jgi:transcription elongation factor Elf1
MGKADHAAAERLLENGRVTHSPVKSPMDTHASDWLIDAPIPCAICGKDAVAKIAVLKARDSIRCGYCGTAIDLNDPGCRAFVEEFSNVVATLFSGPAETADKR